MTFQVQEMTQVESSHRSETCDCCRHTMSNDQHDAHSYGSQQTLETCDHDGLSMDDESVPTYRARAETCLQQADFQQARYFLTKVIAILEQQRMSSFELGKVYLKLAEICCYQEDFDVVIDCCEKAQAIYEAMFPGNVDQMAFLYHAFGDLTALSGTDHAQRWFDKIRNLPTADTWNSAIMADVYARLANYYSRDNDNKKEQAQQFYEKAWEILSQLEAEHDDNYGMTSSAYNNIGKYLQQQGDMPRALSCFERSLKLHDDATPGSASSAEDCFNIGLVLYQQQQQRDNKRNLNEVIEWFQKSLNITESCHKEEKLPLFQTRLAMIEAVCHFGMGQVRHDQGDYQQSLAHYQRALVMLDGVGARKLKALCGVDPRPIPTRAVIEERIQWNPFRLLSLSHDVVPAVWCRMLSSSQFQNDPQAVYYLMQEHPQCSSAP